MVRYGTVDGTMDGTLSDADLSPFHATPTWSPKAVRERIEEAVAVLRLMPLPRHARPDAMRGLWPDIVRDWRDVYGYVDPSPTRVHPTAAQIERCEQALAWLLWLPPEARRLMLARALGVKWRHLERRFGYTERWLRAQLMLACVTIAVRLNGFSDSEQKNHFRNFRKSGISA